MLRDEGLVDEHAGRHDFDSHVVDSEAVLELSPHPRTHDVCVNDAGVVRHRDTNLSGNGTLVDRPDMKMGDRFNAVDTCDCLPDLINR